MKRLLWILISVALLASLLVIPAMATTGGEPAVSGATVRGTTGAPGETVKLTLSLENFANADQISVKVEADSELEWVKEESSWLIAGELADVDKFNKNICAWAAAAAVDVNKPLLELAFKVPEPAVGQTKLSFPVKMTVTVMASGNVLDVVEDTGYVTVLVKATSVTLDKTSLALDLNGTKSQTLNATILPANCTQGASWSSDNTEVATVANGVVTAKKAGTAKITVTVGDVSAQCAVTVSCSHNWTEHPAVTPNCQHGGNNRYFTCDVCDGIYKADKTTPTTEAAEQLPVGTHIGATVWQKNSTHHWHACTTAGCTAEVDKAAHAFQWKLDKAATEDETGLKHEECVCGAKRNEGTVIEKLDHVHVGITHHAAVKATCTKAGTIEYWSCSSSKCAGKYYGDQKCQLALESIVEAINKDNHTGGTEVKDAVAATCSEAGYTGDTYCTGCKVMIAKGSAIAATGKHTPKAGYELDAENHWQLCSHCGIVVAKQAHNFKWIVDQKATESKTGIKHQQCSVCGHKAAEGTVIDKLKHAPQLVAGKAPTCTEAGSAEHFYCGNCGRYYAVADGKAGEQIEKSAVELPATGHSFAQEWTSDEKGHRHVCACGEVADDAAHTAEVVNAKEATDTEPGYTGDTVCSVCGYEISKGQEIPVGETVAPTEETQQPTDGQTEAEGEDQQLDLTMLWWIVPVIAVIAGAVVIITKARKK